MKTYISNGRNYMIFVKLNGGLVPVRFHDQGICEGHGIFVTDDAELASAIERHPRFGQFFYLKEGELPTVAQAEEDKHQYAREYTHVRKTQEAIELLIKNHGVKRSSIMRKEDVLRVAKDLNISFPKLQK